MSYEKYQPSPEEIKKAEEMMTPEEKKTSEERDKLYKLESEPMVKIEIEHGYSDFIPEEFKQNPVGYFKSKGKNIKSGEIIRDESGIIREDPTAVKELPIWMDVSGKELQTIGKKVNIEKGKVGESGDPFYEYKIMEIVKSIGLPAPKPIAKVEQRGMHLIIMEKAGGIGWYEKEALKLKERGYTDEDIENLKKQAEQKMEELKQKFEEAGIHRGWKLKDMIFDIDFENKKIKKITPVDWERTKIDQIKLEKYKKNRI